MRPEDRRRKGFKVSCFESVGIIDVGRLSRHVETLKPSYIRILHYMFIQDAD
jgi:hypothetical protein